MFVDNFKFSWMLRLLALALKINRIRIDKLRTHLKSRNFVIQLQTSDGRVVRHFAFKDGRISSAACLHPAPDFTQVWQSSADAIFALASVDRTHVMRAFEEERVNFKGTFLAGIFFIEALAIMQTGGQAVP